MTFSQIITQLPKGLFLTFACSLLLAASSPHEEVVGEKRMQLAMRMIGHQILHCVGDAESRVLPIELIREAGELPAYRISFAADFGFEPVDIVTIVDHVMTETQVSSHYFVEVQQCETQEVVHGFEVVKEVEPELVTCSSRVLPIDCYTLLITPLDRAIPSEHDTSVLATHGSDQAPTETSESSLLDSVLFLIPLLLLLGFIGIILRRRQPEDQDTHVVAIGASQFDKRNMALYVDNHRVDLSHKEAELLALLHASANAPLEREVILHQVWGDEGNYVGRTLDVFISKLRKKLAGDANVKIVNIRGVGYKLVMNGPQV